jgi:hypothetical protein
MKNALENLRDKLHNMLDSNEYSYEDILKVSEDLDKLIVKYYYEYQ